MLKIRELQNKIQTLQNQISTTQAQINDYKTNSKYHIKAYFCPTCNKQFNYNEPECPTYNCSGAGTYEVSYFNKVRELASAQKTLQSLQNELAGIQSELDSLLQVLKNLSDSLLPPDRITKLHKGFTKARFSIKLFSHNQITRAFLIA